MSTVLIVDDEVPFVRSLIQGLGDEGGHEFLVAGSGKEAVEVMASAAVDLVLTDLRMPDMGGFELVAFLNRHHPAVPIIMMTAYGTPELEQNFRMLGIRQYVEKPIELSALADAIASALEDRQRSQRTTVVGHSGRQLLELLQQSLQGGVNGEVVVRRGQDNGRIFVCKGRIAWVATSTADHNFSTFLMENTEVSHEDLKEVFEESRRQAKNFGETLIEWGLVGRDRLRVLLLRHVCTALLELLTWRETESMFVPEDREYRSNLTFGFEEIVTELNALGAEAVLGWSVQPGEIVREVNRQEAKIKRSLERLASLDGFRSAGAASPSGVLLAAEPDRSRAQRDFAALANDLLREAQDLTERLGLGRVSLLHVSTPQVEILIRCHNENTDFAVTAAGKAHVYTSLVLEHGGNVGLGKMNLEKVTREIAPHCRPRP